MNTLYTKFNQCWPVLTGQLTHVEELLSLESKAFAITVLRVIDFLFSSSIWCSYSTFLLLLYKLLQGKTCLDLGYLLYKEGGQTLEHGTREHVESQCLEIWHSSAQGTEQLGLCWSCIKVGFGWSPEVPCNLFHSFVPFFFKSHLRSQNINPNIGTTTEF